MTFFITWLIVGAILMTALIIKGASIADIENKYSRRYVMLLVTVTCYPAFIVLSILDHFIQFVSGGIGAKKALVLTVTEIGPGFYRDLKDAW